MSIYRKIYESHYGSIPKGYHVHHIDGNHKNNDIMNLQCVTALEHYNIHKSQGDWGACYAMIRTGHLSVTPEERALIASLREKEKVQKGEHIFLNAEFKKYVAGINSNRLHNLAKEGKHPAQSEKNRTALSQRNSKVQTALSYNGIHPFQKKDHREKLSKIVAESNKRRATGTKWWNNGVKNTTSKECPGADWTLGRLNSAWNKGISNIKIKGRKFYNNGIMQRMFEPDKQPTGWVLGRIK